MLLYLKERRPRLTRVTTPAVERSKYTWIIFRTKNRVLRMRSKDRKESKILTFEWSYWMWAILFEVYLKGHRLKSKVHL